MIVHSNGLDEISTMGPTKIIELKDGKMTEWTLNPGEYGAREATLETLAGGDAKSNAETARNILSGKDKGPRKDIVVLNAAAAIIVSGLADGFAPAIRLAEESIASGEAAGRLERLIKVSNIPA